MMNTMCRWLCTMYYLPCSPINLNSESPEAWLKIGYVKVLLYLPPGTELAGYIVILHGSSSECSLRKVTRKIINNAFYIMHSASLCAWIFHTLCKEEVLFSKWIWLAGKDCYGELRLSHKEKKKQKNTSLFMLYWTSFSSEPHWFSFRKSDSLSRYWLAAFLLATGTICLSSLNLCHYI